MTSVKYQRENKCFGVELVHVFGYVNQFPEHCSIYIFENETQKMCWHVLKTTNNNIHFLL